MAALCTAALIIIAPFEPTGEPAVGRSVSPYSNRTFCTPMPSPSAATWVITVGVPVPNSWVAVCTMALPSAYMCALARWVCMNSATG